MSGTETRCECGHVHSANGECYGCDCEDFRPTPDELARLRALASSSSAIREAAERLLDATDVVEVSRAWDRLRATLASSRSETGETKPAALSSSGASPTDTNPTTDA